MNPVEVVDAEAFRRTVEAAFGDRDIGEIVWFETTADDAGVATRQP